jgi:hypothetical protein
MELSAYYLEHLDSLGLRHANWLKSWVGGYTVPELCIKFNVQFNSDKCVLKMGIIVAFKL